MSSLLGPIYVVPFSNCENESSIFGICQVLHFSIGSTLACRFHTEESLACFRDEGHMSRAVRIRHRFYCHQSNRRPSSLSIVSHIATSQSEKLFFYPD